MMMTEVDFSLSGFALEGAGSIILCFVILAALFPLSSIQMWLRS
jgi:hypothetical protein